MKHLLLKEHFRIKKFKKLEAHYRALKFLIHNQTLPFQLRWEASLNLSRILKQQPYSSLKNRCFFTGRSRGYSRFFNLSRIQVRNLARNNDLPFILKSSW
jgi:small subunit ribosomal protein S14